MVELVHLNLCSALCGCWSYDLSSYFFTDKRQLVRVSKHHLGQPAAHISCGTPVGFLISDPYKVLSFRLVCDATDANSRPFPSLRENFRLCLRSHALL